MTRDEPLATGWGLTELRQNDEFSLVREKEFSFFYVKFPPLPPSNQQSLCAPLRAPSLVLSQQRDTSCRRSKHGGLRAAVHASARGSYRGGCGREPGRCQQQAACVARGLVRVLRCVMLAGCFTDALPLSALRPHASTGAYVVTSSAIFPCPKRCQSLFWFGARRRLLCCRFWHLLPRYMGSVHRLRVRLPAPESDSPELRVARENATNFPPLAQAEHAEGVLHVFHRANAHRPRLSVRHPVPCGRRLRGAPPGPCFARARCARPVLVEPAHPSRSLTARSGQSR